MTLAWYVDKVPFAELGWPAFVACVGTMGMLASIAVSAAAVLARVLFGPSYVVRGRRTTTGVSTGTAASGVMLPDLTPVAAMGCAVGGGHALGGGGCDLSGFSIDLNL